MKNHGELHEDTTPHEEPARAPRHEDFNTQQAWLGAASLVGFMAVGGSVGAARATLDGTAPWSDLGLIVAVPLIGLLVALAVWSIGMAVQGYRWRELRGIFHGAAITAAIWLITWLSGAQVS